MGEKYSSTYPKSSEVKIYSYTEVTEVSKNEAVMIHPAECALNGFPTSPGACVCQMNDSKINTFWLTYH